MCELTGALLYRLHAKVNAVKSELHDITVEYRSNETGMSHKKAAHTVPCKPIKAPRQRRKIIGLCEQLKDEIGFIMNKSKEEKEVHVFEFIFRSKNFM